MSDIFRNPSLVVAAGETPYMRDEGSRLAADRQPCIICGHPTGDCHGTSENPTKISFAGEGEVPESLKNSAKILVEEDVFEERQITPFTKITVRLAKKGSYVTLDRAKQLGIVKD